MASPLLGATGPSQFDRDYTDVWFQHAIDEIYRTYGDKTSISAKSKSLNKFGRNLVVGTSFETVAILQGTESNETFVSTNIIDSISSSAVADTGLTVTVEGHTIDESGNLTFSVQNVTTDGASGRTKVSLPTPIARATRAYIANTGTFGSQQSAPTGSIYIYDDTDGISAGVPTTAAATKLVIDIGETQSEKCATTISASDYWIITSFSAGVGSAGGGADRITFRMESRDVANGGAWRPMGRDLVLEVAQQNPVPFQFAPYRIVPKNHDWRIVAHSNSQTASVFAEASGVLASVAG